MGVSTAVPGLCSQGWVKLPLGGGGEAGRGAGGDAQRCQLGSWVLHTHLGSGYLLPTLTTISLGSVPWPP